MVVKKVYSTAHLPRKSLSFSFKGTCSFFNMLTQFPSVDTVSQCLETCSRQRNRRETTEKQPHSPAIFTLLFIAADFCKNHEWKCAVYQSKTWKCCKLGYLFFFLFCKFNILTHKKITLTPNNLTSVFNTPEIIQTAALNCFFLSRWMKNS